MTDDEHKFFFSFFPDLEETNNSCRARERGSSWNAFLVRFHSEKVAKRRNDDETEITYHSGEVEQVTKVADGLPFVDGVPAGGKRDKQNYKSAFSSSRERPATFVLRKKKKKKGNEGNDMKEMSASLTWCPGRNRRRSRRWCRDAVRESCGTGGRAGRIRRSTGRWPSRSPCNCRRIYWPLRTDSVCRWCAKWSS